MTTASSRQRAAFPPFALATFVLVRAALGLVVHGLRRPGAPAAINRLTGKVAPR